MVGLFLPLAVEAQVPADDFVFDSITIITRMQKNETTSIIIDGKVRNVGVTPLSSISLRIESLEIEIISTRFNGTNAQSSMQQMEKHTMIVVHLVTELGSNESGWVHLEVNSTDVQSEPEIAPNGLSIQGGLIFYVRPHNTHNNLTFIAILPEYTQLSAESSVPVFPEADFNFTDGSSLGFVWHVSLLESGQERVFIVGYQSELNERTGLIFTPFEIGLIILISFLIGIVATFTGIHIIPKLKRIQKESVPIAGVTSEEAIVLRILETKGGFCFQRELYDQMEISQSKLSLVLKNLEERGLVRRFRDGRKNEVHLIERTLQSSHLSSADGLGV